MPPRARGNNVPYGQGDVAMFNVDSFLNPTTAKKGEAIQLFDHHTRDDAVLGQIAVLIGTGGSWPGTAEGFTKELKALMAKACQDSSISDGKKVLEKLFRGFSTSEIEDLRAADEDTICMSDLAAFDDLNDTEKRDLARFVDRMTVEVYDLAAMFSEKEITLLRNRIRVTQPFGFRGSKVRRTAELEFLESEEDYEAFREKHVKRKRDGEETGCKWCGQAHGGKCNKMVCGKCKKHHSDYNAVPAHKC